MAKSSDSHVAWAMPSGSTAPSVPATPNKTKPSPNGGTSTWATNPAPTVPAKVKRNPQAITAAAAPKALVGHAIKQAAPYQPPSPRLAVRAPRAKTKGQM